MAFLLLLFLIIPAYSYAEDPCSNNPSYIGLYTHPNQILAACGMASSDFTQSGSCSITCPDGSAGTTSWSFRSGSMYDYKNWCGGCESPDPSHCSDGSKSGDEYGIDCGGSCGSQCQEYCPEGTANVTYRDEPGCWEKINTDQYGNCPLGWTKGDQLYSKAEDPTASTWCAKNHDPYLAGEPQPDQVAPDPWKSGTFSVVTSEGPATTVDNGDGTSTTSKTTTTTTTGADGTSSTSTTTEETIIDNATGNKISSGTRTEGEVPPTENPGNYDYSLPEVGEYDKDLGEYEGKEVVFTENKALTESDFFQTLRNLHISTSGGTSSVDFSYGGTTISYDLNKPWLVDALEKLGSILVFVSYVTGFMIIVRR